ncbi:MAG TPA: hypothetical protein VI485_19690 [Vicinamibacterales bacterium]|nr:hypothetical protein [Vicinamibacterales bacterium]
MQRQPDARLRDISSPDPLDHDLGVRIRAEFAEMPGLKLTLPQASRLFNLDLGKCERVLCVLVDGGALSISRGAFVHGGAGRRYV